MQLTIGKLASAGDVGVETIRYYQRRGLMGTPARSGGDGWGGGVRRYDENDLRRLKFIRSAQASGFTLEEIAELLALEESDDRVRVRSLARQRIDVLDAKDRADDGNPRGLGAAGGSMRGERQGTMPDPGGVRAVAARRFIETAAAQDRLRR